MKNVEKMLRQAHDVLYDELNRNVREMTTKESNFIRDCLDDMDTWIQNAERKFKRADKVNQSRRIRSGMDSDYASSDSFDLGFEAYFNDVDPYEENPYEYQSEDWFEWRRGYEKASAQEEFERDELYSGCHGKSKKGKKVVKSAFEEEDSFEIYPYNNDVDPHSDEDLGLSAVIEVYGDEFVNVDDNTLSGMRDTLERYFDDEAYVRDWNIMNPNDKIESIEDVESVSDLDVDTLARYFDYDAYGRDIRIGDGYRWDDEKNCWIN